jgi:hypothetical protein
MPVEDSVVLEAPPVTDADIQAFCRATGTDHSPKMALTYPTRWRTTEFEWLGKLNIDMRSLLHTGQEYEFLHPLKAGEIPIIVTRMKSMKERGGMRFITLESLVSFSGVVKVKSLSTFVVRPDSEGFE